MFNKKKKMNYFYQCFIDLFEYSIKSFDILKTDLEAFNKDSNLLDLKEKVHTLEHEADLKKDNFEEILAKEFITPIERADIFILLDLIDDLIDSIDDIAYKIYLKNYLQLPKQTNLFLEKCYICLQDTFKVFNNFNNIDKKDVITPLINKVKEDESNMDILYEQAIHELYRNNEDLRTVLLYEDLLSSLEIVTDKCRDICKEVLIILYKNL